MSRRKQSNPRQIKRKLLGLLLLLLFVSKPGGVKLDETEIDIDQFFMTTDSSSRCKCPSFSPSLNSLCWLGVFVFNEAYFTITVRFFRLVCYAFIFNILREYTCFIEVYNIKACAYLMLKVSYDIHPVNKVVVSDLKMILSKPPEGLLTVSPSFSFLFLFVEACGDVFHNDAVSDI